MSERSFRIVFLLGLAIALVLVGTSSAFAGGTRYWPGGLKLAFVQDDYGHVDVVYPACDTPVETYMWVVYDPNGDWLAGSNYENPGGQFTPTISGRYKMVVKAMIWPDAVDTLKATYRYTAP